LEQFVQNANYSVILNLSNSLVRFGSVFIWNRLMPLLIQMLKDILSEDLKQHTFNFYTID